MDAKQKFLYPAALIVIVMIGYFPITRVMLRQGDFPNHIRRAVDLTQGQLDVPHFLFHALTGLGILFGLAPTAAAAAVMLGFQALAAWGGSWLARRSGASPGIAMCLGILLVFVAPILPVKIAADADVLPHGYFLPNALHNPTVTAAKAFVPFLIDIGVTAAGAATVLWSSSSVAVIVILAGLAKPHYVSCLLPVVAVMCVWRWWRGQHVPLGMVLSFAIAATAVLLWTVVGTTALAGGGTSIIAPLAGLRSWGHLDVPVDALSIAGRACSDLAFPIVVLALWPDARRFPSLLVAWAAYGIGFGQALLVAETGRISDGNFMWGAQLATFGLMAASAAWLGRSSVRWNWRNWRVVAAWSFLLLHVAYGVWWINARVVAG